MAEYNDEDPPPKEIPAHDRNCLCNVCWSNGRGARRCGDGRCSRCSRSVDDHALDAKGMIMRCPKPGKVAA